MVEPMIGLAWLLAVAQAAPSRAPRPRPAAVAWEAGRARDVLVVKLAEGRGLRWEGGRVTGPGDLTALNALLTGATPRFSRSPEAIRADRATYDPERRLADLTLYLTLRAPDAARRGDALLAFAEIEDAWLAPLPVPPPEDLPPETPDFSGEQGYLGAAPDGLGFDEARAWPGGTGDRVTLADVEYDWLEDHEDLGAVAAGFSWGLDSDEYDWHGTSVLGELVGGDNGYGVTGMVPDAAIVMVSPYEVAWEWDIAAAIDGAASLLDAGDVILIEQQSYVYGPVESEPDVFDAITLAVAKGIVVVEPAGNGALDLDDPGWDGWFDRATRDSGAILVGGGASPLSGLTPRSWYTRGSCYGARVDLQGWYDHIVTATTGAYGGSLADLQDIDDDRQAYTASFGGTSGASPMIAAAAAVAQSVAWSVWGAPWDPVDLRAALVSTGTPQAAGDTHLIGPQPDLRRFLRTWAAR